MIRKLIPLLLLLTSCATFNVQENWEWKFYNNENSELPTNKIHSVFIDKNNSRWICTWDAGLAILDSNGFTVYDSSNSPLPTNTLYSVKEDFNGAKWISTFGGGLVNFNNGEWKVYNNENSDLPHNWIYGIDFDKKNNLWIGTWGSGLAKYNGSNFENVKIGTSSLPYKIPSVAIDENNIKWIGSINGLFKLEGDSLQYFTEKNSCLPGQSVYSLLPIGQNELWVGFKQHGIAHLTENNCVYFNPEQLPFRKSYAITRDKNGNIWVATFGNGIARFDGTEWKIFNTKNSKLPDDLVFHVTTDNRGRLWISTYNSGIAVINLSGK